MRPALAVPLMLLTGSALALAALPPTAAQTARPATLVASPGNGGFTAGQEIVLRGAIGGPGRRAVHLESNLGRSGDRWVTVEGTTTRTDASGAFTLKVPAHSSQIVYRVASGSRRTPTWTSVAVPQEVTLTASGPAVAGRPLTLVASTTSMPLLAGRALTLQERAGTGWTSIASATLGPDGRASFSATPPAGGTVYRVRAEDWDRGVGHVGWFPSYPLYVGADDRAQRAPSSRLAHRPAVPRVTKAPPHQVTAAASGGWGSTRYDFDWERGESLTDPASGGSRPRGAWLDASDGTGRVMMRNGAMQLSSNSEGAGRSGSVGSLSATLSGSPQAYGRWETRAMPMVFAGGATDYALKVELLPVADAVRGCDARAISLVEARPSTPGITIGARAGGTSWRRDLSGVTTRQTFHAYAVEVTSKKITWFVDGRPVGRVSDPAAISGQPMTVRVSMQAAGSESMRTTRTLVDWVRAYPAGTGRPARGGSALTATPAAATC